MARVPAATRETIPQQHQAVFDEVVQSLGGVPQGGAFFIYINSPEAAKRARHLSDYLFHGSVLSHEVQQLVILLTAREMDCRFIWNAHASRGRQATSDRLVDALRDRKELPPDMSAEEAAVVRYCQELVPGHQVSPGTFQAALEQFGVQGLTEVTMLMGYYTMHCLALNAFEVEPPSDTTEPLLPV